ncbi:phosphopentomutase [Deinococcus peraridilitoris]|uniref:Phosphopentomutase n=1 Tax=Deinococcus peraridilitoris (strain DSM 19664 / LMG 22246 / CIP 109416 / KR-200) TaxID=937777 RepID=K9ZY97_DEIPD|nr:phosphopentomutase [Deinococcus peraridilitoris]AFZ65725.1 phosphopentomutase [Deinococcus peraridilitoris DSM 19664]
MKVTLIVLDSVGVGELPDAAAFGDVGAHTLNHVLQRTGVELAQLARLGLGGIESVLLEMQAEPLGSFGRLREVSPGKDTSTGHWEFMGVQLEHPFQTFAEGFPPEVMERFSQATGRGWLCNRPYSGTDVIRDYGEEHMRTGNPIVYTSADSVFQIAAHVDVVPLETLYRWCRAAREILQGPHAVARVIARPFRGDAPFERANEARKDFSLTPPPTVLNALHSAGLDVIGIGKIPDIYDHSGFTEEIHTDDNLDGIEKTLRRMRAPFHGLVFTNLVDFDAKYGHRRDPEGYAAALAAFDERLPELLDAVEHDGLLLIVSDHGNDPTWHGTDHTREYGLLLAYRPGIPGVDLGERATFADVGATVAEALGVSWSGPGESFWPVLSGPAGAA